MDNQCWECKLQVYEAPSYLDDDMHVKFFGIQPNAFIESCALAIVEIHCDIDLPSKFEDSVSVQGKEKK